MRPDIWLERQDQICAFVAAVLRVQDYAARVLKAHNPGTATQEEKDIIVHLAHIATGSTVIVIALSRSPDRVCIYDPEHLPEGDLKRNYSKALLVIAQELVEWYDYAHGKLEGDFDWYAPRNQTKQVLAANMTELVNLFDMYNHVPE